MTPDPVVGEAWQRRKDRALWLKYQLTPDDVRTLLLDTEERMRKLAAALEASQAREDDYEKALAVLRTLLDAERVEKRNVQAREDELREALAETKKRLAGFYNPYGETDANRDRYPHAPTVRPIIAIIDRALSASPQEQG